MIEHRFTIFKYDFTWKHHSLTKLGHIKSTSSKHVTFERSCKSHQISYVATTNYLWLPLKITNYLWLPSIKFVRCNPIYGGPINVRTMCWTFFCAFEFSSYMSWITFPNDILVELSIKYFVSNFHPIWHLPVFPPNMLQTLKFLSVV